MFLRVFPIALAVGIFSTVNAASPVLERQFQQNVKPVLTKYCVTCHSGQTPAAQFDIKAYTNADIVTRDYPRWALASERLKAQEMPPKAMPQPSDESRKEVIDWIQAVRADEARRNAGDPGLVPARRLSNAEYNYTVRDLTGQDLQPTKEFPVDPANQAGFDNSGESLTMSSGLLNKYLQAARDVSNHMVLTPDGFDFAPWPMLAESDREKYAIKRIVDFYFSQPTDYTNYFEAAWRYKNRVVLGKPTATLATFAADAKVSPKYLPMIWQLLQEKDAAGPVAKLQTMFRELPAPAGKEQDAKQAADLRAKCAAMRDFAVKIRSHTAMQFSAPLVKGLPAGSQPLLNWKLRRYTLHRLESDPAALRNDTDPPPVAPEIPRYAGLHQEAAPRWAALTLKARAGDADLVIPAAQRAKYQAAFARFATVFPDVFYVTERGRYFPDDSSDKGRLLSAGYHSVAGYFRDDKPLMDLVLDEKGRKQIDRLWDEFDYIANFTDRTWTQYFFNQAGEVDGKGAEAAAERPADHLITDTEVIMAMRDKYLAKAAADPKSTPEAQLAIRDHYDRINAVLRGLEKERKESEPKHLEALMRFAARAYRRPLTKAEQDDLRGYFHTLREKNSLSDDDAIRNCIVSVLMSPGFLYRVDLLDTAVTSRSLTTNVAAVTTAPGPRVHPLTGYALANKLSYFLWASMPDDELLRHAAAGDLQRPDMLLAQAHRMMKDKKAVGFATEFAGNWLDFRRFETNNSVDRQRFPTFTNDLREAMFQEPIRYIQDVIENNRPVLDLIYGNYTFVNPPLAKHYGMPDVPGTNDTWVKLEGADKYQRGGLLPMAVFLTQNSPGLRTSPVKRGYWIVRRVLGEVIPPPPPVVPELPHDEAKSDLPVRDLLAQHRQNPLCGGCHARFDVFGLTLEGYGPTGEARTKDLAGRTVDTNASFPGGSQGTGVEGVRAYIREHRQNDFVDNLSRKLLAYALNRSLQLSDETLVDRMKARLAAGQNRFGALVDTIVTSPQFLNKRNPAPKERETLALLRKGE